MTRSSVRLVAGLVGGVVAVAGASLVGGCSVPAPSSGACGQATDATLLVLQSKLTVNATLRNGKTIGPTAAGWTLVSAELHRNGDKTDARGDILTWALPVGASDTGSAFLAVDSKARSDSTWPRAPIAVTAAGAITSRGCVESVRGTVPCLNEGSGLTVSIGVKAGNQCETTTVQAP